MAINEVIMDKILMLRKEGHMGARGIYIGMRRQAPELGPMRYAYACNKITSSVNVRPFLPLRHSGKRI